MAENPFLGAIFLFGGNFAPTGYALCDGQLLSIAQNTALFSILGTTFGGDGVSTFGLPNLQSRVPVGSGQGSGLSPYVLGEMGGVESVALDLSQMPEHSHPLQAGGTQTTNLPASALPAQDGAYASGSPSATMSPSAIGEAGSSQPHTNIQPYVAVTYIIALEGVFPSRS
ncbi:MAG: phage tail protein [Solirubrobacteraceae bacterium]